MQGANNHDCCEHLLNGNCQICGKHHHRWVQNGGGSGSGLVIRWCYDCHTYSAYYDDTGSDVILVTEPDFEQLSITDHRCEDFKVNGICLVCKKAYPVKTTEEAKTFQEPIYAVLKSSDGKYFLNGLIDRKTAETCENRIFHCTVIIVPFIADGKDKGKFIVHDRMPKLWAKGCTYNRSCPSERSLNFLGGHVAADINNLELLFKEIPQELFDDSDELSQELKIRSDNSEETLEVWETGAKTQKNIGVKPYDAPPLIPIGMTVLNWEYNRNREYSYLYALPVPSEDVPKLVMADDYISDEETHNVYLPMAVMDEKELLMLRYREPYSEVCDAIKRLWEPKNAEVYNKLIATINNL